MLPRRAASPDFDSILAGSLGTGLPFAQPEALRLSGVPLPATGQVLPPAGRGAGGDDVAARQGPLTAPLLAVPVSAATTCPAGSLQPPLEGEMTLPQAAEQAPLVRQAVPNSADPRPLPAVVPAPLSAAESPLSPAAATGVAVAPLLPMKADAVPAKAGPVAGAVGERYKQGAAPGSELAPPAITARPAGAEVPALAAAEHKDAEQRPGLDQRQATDTGLPAAHAALRPERALSPSLDVAEAAPEAEQGSLKEPLGTPRWQHELGQRLATLAGQGVREVRLQLHPEHLGPLEVRITLHDSQVGLWFGAQNAETRDALEQSLPRLREMFAQGGLTMTDASVAQHQQDRGGQAAAAREAPWNAPAAASATPSEEPGPRVTAQHSARLIDEYA